MRNLRRDREGRELAVLAADLRALASRRQLRGYGDRVMAGEPPELWWTPPDMSLLLLADRCEEWGRPWRAPEDLQALVVMAREALSDGGIVGPYE